MKIPKIKWNHINRGLVLGLALGAGTAVYVMVQNAMFKNNIPEISARAEEICRSMAETNTGDNREGVQRMLTSCIQDNFINTPYALTAEDEYNGTRTRTSMLFEIETMETDQTGCDKVLSTEYKQISTSVSKWGVDGANVQVDYIITCECEGIPLLQTPNGMLNLALEVRKQSDKPLKKEIEIKGSCNMIMQKENGVWKAINVSSTDPADPYRINIEYPDGNEGGEADGQE
ncbi:hypothetical protein [uncultured Ruminococcus sp.]|uniref:hypothetical protein n=1 Tax=uncultured Ruminococcus sp. TaxID=165186 RepID=UPI0025F7681B|nr:hypothetical protein [uncultured Ruminococcus sp.]